MGKHIPPPAPHRRNSLRLIAAIAIAAAVATAGYILYTYNPLSVGFYPRCPSKLITGYDCPGCGSLRGLHALMHGRLADAWHFNAAIYFALAALAMIGTARIWPPLRRITHHEAFSYTILAFTIGWTILRNII